MLVQHSSHITQQINLYFFKIMKNYLKTINICIEVLKNINYEEMNQEEKVKKQIVDNNYDLNNSLFDV